MKRKFFSMMVAACAALFSVTGFISCGGGGGGSSEQQNRGYLTYDGFTRLYHGIRIEASSVYLTIKPYASVDDDYAVENEELPSGAARRMYVTISNASGTIATQAIASYVIKTYQSEEGIGLAEGELPYHAQMTIALGDASANSNSQILAALFLPDKGGNFQITRGIVLDLYFVGGNGGTVSLTTTGRYISGNLVTVEVNVPGYGPFAVVE